MCLSDGEPSSLTTYSPGGSTFPGTWIVSFTVNDLPLLRWAALHTLKLASATPIRVTARLLAGYAILSSYGMKEYVQMLSEIPQVGCAVLH